VVGTLVQDPLIWLVAHDPQVLIDRELRDPLQVGHLKHAARGVLGRVDDDHAGLVGHERGQFVHVEAEVVLLTQRTRHGLGAHEVDHRLVDREAGVRVDDLVALVHAGGDSPVNDGLGAEDDGDVLHLVVGAAATVKVPGDGLTELRIACAGPVVGIALVHGFASGIDDVLRCVEVGLADLEVDDIPALAFQLLGPRENRESGLRAQTFHALCQLRHVRILPEWW